MIEINNVSYKYKTGIEVIKNINIKINDGEFVAIIGKNGSGKSTISKLITGLEKPTKGDVIIKENMPMLFFSNIIFYDNSNKTLPVGMNLSAEVMIDLNRIEIECRNCISESRKSNCF